MYILKSHIDEIIWTCVFILSFIGAVFAQDCSIVLNEYFTSITNKKIQIEVRLESDTLEVVFDNNFFQINEFHRLKVKPNDLKDFLQTLNKTDLLNEMEILSRLTSDDRYFSTTISEREFRFSDIFKRNINTMFYKKNISLNDKLDSYFKLYWEERMSMLTMEQRDKLKFIFDDMDGSELRLNDRYKKHKSFYTPIDHKIVTRDKYHYKIVELIVKVHEAEHAITRILYPAFNNLNALNLKEHKVSKRFRKIQKLHVLLNEGNSIAAQWEFVQNIPEELRRFLLIDLSVFKGEIPNLDQYAFMDSEIELVVRTNLKKKFNDMNVSEGPLEIGAHSLFYANLTKEKFVNQLRNTHHYKIELIDGHLVYEE